MNSSADPKRPALEVADILRQYGAAFSAKYGSHLTGEQRQALRIGIVRRRRGQRRDERKRRANGD